MNARNCCQRRATSHKYPQILHPASPASHNKVDIYEQLVNNNVNPTLDYTNQTHMQFWILPLACLGLSGIETDGPRGEGGIFMQSIEIRRIMEINTILQNWDRNKQTPTQSQQNERKHRKHRKHKKNVENGENTKNTEKTP